MRHDPPHSLDTPPGGAGGARVEMMLYLAMRWHALADEAEGKKPPQPRAPSPPLVE
jgi:hypothetical protein